MKRKPQSWQALEDDERVPIGAPWVVSYWVSTVWDWLRDCQLESLNSGHKTTLRRLQSPRQTAFSLVHMVLGSGHRGGVTGLPARDSRLLIRAQPLLSPVPQAMR